ncbi:MAG: hypothetical protein HY901_14695 [Deltaproteobacteria bacterium]|nr:hypothetical protein [Deltaproteobacteria bacterium]
MHRRSSSAAPLALDPAADAPPEPERTDVPWADAPPASSQAPAVDVPWEESSAAPPGQRLPTPPQEILELFGIEEPSAAGTTALPRGRRRLKAAGGSALLLFLGLGTALAIHEPQFGWIGGAAAASVGGTLMAREAGFSALASLLGLAAFFGTVVLVVAGLLVGAIASLPALLGT